VYYKFNSIEHHINVINNILYKQDPTGPMKISEFVDPCPPINIGGVEFETVSIFKVLGVTL
jgi:hypothetical protein